MSLLCAMFGILLISGSTKASVDGLNLLEESIGDTEKSINVILSKNCTRLKEYLGLLHSQVLESGKPPDTSNIKLRLYTPTQTVDFNLMLGGSQILEHPSFNVSLPIVVYNHGFLTEMKGRSVIAMTRALLRKGGLNVLALDTNFLMLANYLKASTSTVFIGRLLGKALADMYNGGAGVKLDKMRIIGHSLGAHVSGIAGKTFRNLTGVIFSRITGLDPAGPCFLEEASEQKLASSDASFVDIIHSDAGVLGYQGLLGHADFYPNNGVSQPNCLLIGCSHSRSWRLFAESIADEDSFPATPCISWPMFLAGICNGNPKVNMGYGLPPGTRGVYFLKTRGSSPFGLKEPGSIS